MSTYVRCATVFGDFDPTSMTVWLNKDYCKNGYAYLTPMVKQNLRLYEFRKALDLSNNMAYDLMFSMLSVPGLKHLMYYTPLTCSEAGSKNH